MVLPDIGHDELPDLLQPDLALLSQPDLTSLTAPGAGAAALSLQQPVFAAPTAPGAGVAATPAAIGHSVATLAVAQQADLLPLTAPGAAVFWSLLHAARARSAVPAMSANRFMCETPKKVVVT